jgi:hypothetical protein
MGNFIEKCLFCQDKLKYILEGYINEKYHTYYCDKCGMFEHQIKEDDIKLIQHRIVYCIPKYRIVQYYQNKMTIIYKRSKSGYQPDAILRIPAILEINVKDINKTTERIENFLIYK